MGSHCGGAEGSGWQGWGCGVGPGEQGEEVAPAVQEEGEAVLMDLQTVLAVTQLITSIMFLAAALVFLWSRLTDW